MPRPVKHGSTDQSTVIRILSTTTFTPLDAIEHDTAGLALWYRREGGTKATITPAALAALDTAHADGGIEHISDGYYRIDVPDAAFASGADGVAVGGSVTDGIVIAAYHPLVANVEADTYGRIGAPSGASISADLGSMRGATFDTATDSLEALRNRGDAAWVTATGFSTLDAAGVRSAVGLASANLDTQLGTIDSNVDAVLLDTAEIGAAGAGLTAVPWNAAWDAEVQSECADALTAAEPLDANLVSVEGDPLTRTLQAGTTTSLTLATTESDVNDAYAGWLVWLSGGTGAGQLAEITDYVGSTRVATVVDATTKGALATAPDATTTYQLSSPTHATNAPGSAADVADAVLARDAANVEDTAPEHSLTYLILAATEAVRSGGTLTVRKTDGSTTFASKTITTSAVDAVTEIA